jgi:LPS-assembly lipoprotein
VQVRARLNFRLRTPAGKVLIAPTEIALSRDMSYSESVALAKEQEEALLYRAMQTDIVSQVMRRLAAVTSL